MMYKLRFGIIVCSCDVCQIYNKNNLFNMIFFCMCLDGGFCEVATLHHVCRCQNLDQYSHYFIMVLFLQLFLNEHVQLSKFRNLVFKPWNYEILKWFMVHSSSIFVVAFTCFADGIQYANLLLIAFLLQQPFVDDRWCATTFDNLIVVDSEDCALPWKKTWWSGRRLRRLLASCQQLLLDIHCHWC